MPNFRQMLDDLLGRAAPLPSEADMAPRYRGAPFKHLRLGGHYVVVLPFTDYDRALHPEGEAWQFLGHSFLPYDDGLSLFVSAGEGHERHIRLQWRPEEQGEVIDNLAKHIQPLEASAKDA